MSSQKDVFSITAAQDISAGAHNLDLGQRLATYLK